MREWQNKTKGKTGESVHLHSFSVVSLVEGIAITVWNFWAKLRMDNAVWVQISIGVILTES